MKFTWNWLCDHLDTTASLDEILDVLPMIGLEVEEVDNPAIRLADFTVAEIISAERHPNADKLQVCRVNTGKEEVQIVCGAPNARAGLKTVLAVPGTYIPGLDITIKKGEIRGEESHGTCLCCHANLGACVGARGSSRCRCEESHGRQGHEFCFVRSVEW